MEFSSSLRKEFGELQRFYKIHCDFVRKDEVASYCALLYVVTKMTRSKKLDKEAKQFMMGAFGKLEEMKRKLMATPYRDVITSEFLLSAHLSDIANNLYSYSENEELNKSVDNVNNIIRCYVLCSSFFALSRHFNNDALSEEDSETNEFAIKRSVFLKKALDKKNAPVDPLPEAPSTVPSAERAVPPPTIPPSIPPNTYANFEQNSNFDPSANIPVKVVEKVQGMLKSASSAFSFYDVKTTISLCRQVITALEALQNK